MLKIEIEEYYEYIDNGCDCCEGYWEPLFLVLFDGGVVYKTCYLIDAKAFVLDWTTNNKDVPYDLEINVEYYQE